MHRSQWFKSWMVVLISAGALAGCTTSEMDLQHTSESTSPSPSPTPSPTPSLDAYTACEIFFDAGLLERISPALTSIGGTLDGEALDELLDINATIGEALEVAPPNVALPLQALGEPFEQVQDVADSGGGELTMDTSNIMADMTTLLDECSAAGYRLDE